MVVAGNERVSKPTNDDDDQVLKSDGLLPSEGYSSHGHF